MPLFHKDRLRTCEIEVQFQNNSKPSPHVSKLMAHFVECYFTHGPEEGAQRTRLICKSIDSPNGPEGLSPEEKKELHEMNEGSLHTDTSLMVNGVERFLLRIKPGNSPGLACKAGLWADIGAATDQSEINAPALVQTVKRLLESIRKSGVLPSWTPGASKLFSAARKLDRYAHNRVHGEVCDSGNGPFLNSEDMRTRLICSGCVVYTNCMRSLFSPLYVSQKRCPLTSLASGATIEQTFKQVDTEGPFGSVWVAQSSGQPAVGCQVLKALGVLASKANSTFLIVAGDSLYMFRSKDLDSTAIKKRVDAVTPMLSEVISEQLTSVAASNDLVLDDSANPETKDDYSGKIAAALDSINDPGLKALIMETPLLEGVITDTSTSDLRIRPFALPLMQGMLEILCTCSSEEGDNKLKAAQEHVNLMHNPLIALQSSGQIMKFAALGSGAYLHEVSTAMATLVTALT